MIVSEVIVFLEELAPPQYAENFDNVGLLVGSASEEVSGVLVCLDVTEDVIQEAISTKSNLIISFHPLVFERLKTIKSDGNYVQKILYRSIQNNLNIYAIHTNLDNARFGVNHQIAQKIGLENYKVLIPKENTLLKLNTYIPTESLRKIQNLLFEIGAGQIGTKYDSCSFFSEGIGTFKPMESANPFIGERNNYFEGKECQLSMIFEAHLEQKVIKTLVENHPYEEVAYEITQLKNKNPNIGMGGIGELVKEVSVNQFFESLKESFRLSVIKHSKIETKKIKKIAFLGGAGAFGIGHAIRSKADVYLTSDLKYHNFFEAENKIILIDIGHYESEQFTKELLVGYLTKKINKFAILESKVRTNPVYYFK